MLDRWIPRVVGVAIAVLACQVCADDHLARVLLERLTFPSSVQAGRPYQVKHCRRAPHGCPERVSAFVRYFRRAGELQGADPYLLASMAWHESRLNPWAVGRGGERGILQIHPRQRHARGLEIWDAWDRKRCAQELGACQWGVVRVASGILRRSVDTCGSIELGLGMYNSGRCRKTGYARRILKTWRELRGDT